jgi:hypothetical protein
MRAMIEKIGRPQQQQRTTPAIPVPIETSDSTLVLSLPRGGCCP